MITHLITNYGFGTIRFCGLIGMSRSLYRYEAKRPDDVALKMLLIVQVYQKRRYGYRRLHALLQPDSWAISGSARTECIEMPTWQCAGASAGTSPTSNASQR